MPDKFFVISGSFVEVNRQLDLAEAATIPAEERAQAIADDLYRSAFIDSDNKTVTDYKKNLEATRNSTPFSQGLIDGSFYQPILDNYLFSRITTYPTDYIRENHPTLGFAYFDDAGIPCAVSIHYLATNPEYWTVSIIRNTTAEPQDREVFVMCTPDLISGNDNSAQKTPKQAQKAFSTFLNSKKINTLLKNVIQADGEANTKLLGILQTMIAPNMTLLNQNALTEKTNEANNRVTLFVNRFKQKLLQALTDRTESVDAILSRANITRNNKVPTAKELTTDFDALMASLDSKESLRPPLEAQQIPVEIAPNVSYQIAHPLRIIGVAKEAGLTEAEINKLSHSQLLLFASAVFLSFETIFIDLKNAMPPPENLDLMKYNELQQMILESCNKVLKEVLQAYLKSAQPDFKYDEQAYLDLLKKIGSEFVISDNQKVIETLTLTQPESDTENKSPANTPWSTRLRQVGLAILAVSAIAIVGFFTAPLILTVVSTVISGVFAAVTTGVILAAAAVAIGALFYGINKLIEVYQAKQNEPPISFEESEPLNKVEASLTLSNQMSGLGKARETPAVSAPTITATTTMPNVADAEEEKNAPHPK
jgi:hypothetical protein